MTSQQQVTAEQVQARISEAESRTNRIAEKIALDSKGASLEDWRMLDKARNDARIWRSVRDGLKSR